MDDKIFGEHGGILPNPSDFRICQRIETKRGTVIELCIFYPKTEEFVLLIYANEFMTPLFCL